jgi:hypothetical protein
MRGWPCPCLSWCVLLTLCAVHCRTTRCPPPKVAEERALASKCGNPLCSNPYTQQDRRAAFRCVQGAVTRARTHAPGCVPTTTSDNTPTPPAHKHRVTSENVHRVQQHCYCSRACEAFVTQLAAQLVKPLDRLAPTGLGKALKGQQQLQSHRPKQQQGTAAQGGGVETMKALVTVRVRGEREGVRARRCTGACWAARSVLLTNLTPPACRSAPRSS